VYIQTNTLNVSHKGAPLLGSWVFEDHRRLLSKGALNISSFFVCDSWLWVPHPSPVFEACVWRMVGAPLVSVIKPGRRSRKRQCIRDHSEAHPSNGAKGAAPTLWVSSSKSKG
jgi:hypothetical protein